MPRQTLTRVLLVVLALLAVGVVVRRAAPAPEPDATLTFGTKWDAEELRHRTVEVDGDGPIALTAIGSFGERAGEVRGDQLAAFAWIVRRSDGAVVWQMRPDEARRIEGDGTLAEVADRLTLAPGLYDAYFSTYGFDEGDHFWNRARWKADRDAWRFRLDDGGRGVLANVTDRDSYAEGAGRATGDEVVYRTGPVPRRTERSAYLRVEQPVQVRIQSVGEVPRDGDGGDQQDYAFLQNVYTGRPVWEMTRATTEPAGGHPRNRAADAVLTLEPGLYRAGYRTDGGHGPGDWWMAPPLDPLGWGLTLSYADPAEAGSGAIAESDVRRLPVVAQLAPLGDDERRAVRFEVADSLRVLALGLGELRSGARYDYAWLVREAGADSPARTVWEMQYADSEPAGGESRNRRVEAALTLAPGTYTLHAKTDDSHSADRWRDSAPHDAEHWGATLYAFDRGYAGAPATEIPVSSDQGDEWAVPPPEIPAPPPPAASPVASAPAAPPSPPVEAFSGVPAVQPLPVVLAAPGPDARLSSGFELDEPARVRVVALGELSLTARYDYGWIERVREGEPGERVWEMTMDDAAFAGGLRRNRLADVELELPAGRYAARYVTDGSHDPSSFTADTAPEGPATYGLRIERVK